MIKRRLTALLLAVVMLMLGGCSQTDPLLDEGLAAFVDNRIETPPYMPQSVLDKLDDMLLQFSGGVSRPSGTIISATDQTPLPDPNTSTNAQTGVAPNITVFEQILRAAVCDTNDMVSVQLTGFTVDFDDIIELMDGIIFTEMIGYMCIESYQMLLETDASGNQVVTVVFNYSLPVDVIRQMKLDAAAAAQMVVDNLGLVGKSDIEIVTAVNQYLCDNAYYSTSDPYTPADYTAYGALINGVCVCDGYTRAAQYIFELCGLDVMYVGGETPGGLHAWNLVKVGGAWYHLDITWNDTEPPYLDYFLVTDDYMSVSRVWETADYPPTPMKNYA